MGDLVVVQSGYAFKSSDGVSEENPVIKIKNIDSNYVNTTNCEYLADDVAEKVSKLKINSGALLIAMTGATVGKISFMPRIKKQCYLNQRVGIFRLKSGVNPVPFLFTYFNSDDAKHQVLNYAGGAAQP